ncbi:hypothetical protein JCM18237_27700 [Halorubrum luteum]
MRGRGAGARGQTNLPVLAVALIMLTAVTGMTIAIAESAYLSSERDASERAIAVSVADRIVAADADVTRRQNVLDAAALEEFSRRDAVGFDPDAADVDLRIRVDENILVDHGEPEGGTTIRRIALVSEIDTWQATTTTEPGDSLTIPRRTNTVVLGVDGDVRTISINDRPVAHAPTGIDEHRAPIRVATSQYETVTVSATGDGGAVHVESFPENTEKAIVTVTVDA